MWNKLFNILVFYLFIEKIYMLFILKTETGLNLILSYIFLTVYTIYLMMLIYNKIKK